MTNHKNEHDTARKFREAIDQRNPDLLPELFADDVRFFSPMKFTPFEGKGIMLGLLGVLLRTFEEFRYVGEFDGTAETAAGADTRSDILMFRARVGDKQIHGIDMLQFDDAGLIKEFTVMVRPQSAAVALGAAVQQGLIADGLLPPS